jgi:hypothetical protein
MLVLEIQWLLKYVLSLQEYQSLMVENFYIQKIMVSNVVNASSVERRMRC